MLTALITMIVLAVIMLGLTTHPVATLALVVLATLVMMFPLWALGIFAVLAAAFGLFWVKS